MHAGNAIPALDDAPGLPTPPLTVAERYPRTPWAAARLYRSFVLAAIASGGSGFLMGAALLIARATGGELTVFRLASIQVHGAVQLIGWCGLFTMGVATHVIPRFRGNNPIPFPWPQRATLTLVAGGLAVRAIAQPWSGMPGRSAILAGGGLSVAAGLFIFAATAGMALSRGQAARRPVEHWLWLGLAGAVTTGVAYLGLSVDLAQRDAALADARWNAAFHAVALYGFLVPFAFGVSGRAVAGLFGLRARHDHLDLVALPALLAGLALLLIEGAGAGTDGLAEAGRLLTAAALVIFTVGLRVLEPGASAPVWPRRYVTVAYVWLIVAALVLLLRSVEVAGGRFSGHGQPELHALGAGFLSNLIVGFGSRALPLFEHRALRGTVCLRPAFWMLQVSVASRVIGAFVTLPGFALTAGAASGVVGFALGVAPLLDLLLRRRSATETPPHRPFVPGAGLPR